MVGIEFCRQTGVSYVIVWLISLEHDLLLGEFQRLIFGGRNVVSGGW